MTNPFAEKETRAGSFLGEVFVVPFAEETLHHPGFQQVLERKKIITMSVDRSMKLKKEAVVAHENMIGLPLFTDHKERSVYRSL